MHVKKVLFGALSKSNYTSQVCVETLHQSSEQSLLVETISVLDEKTNIETKMMKNKGKVEVRQNSVSITRQPFDCALERNIFEPK